jgi:hypothetical protein
MTEPGDANVQVHNGDMSVQMSEFEDFGSEIQFRPDTPPYLQGEPERSEVMIPPELKLQLGAQAPVPPSLPQMPVFLPAQMMVNSLKQQEAPPEAIRMYLQQQAAALDVLRAQYAPPKPVGSELEQLRAELNQVKGEKMQLEFLTRQMNFFTASRLQQLEQVNLTLNEELRKMRDSARPDDLEFLRSRERDLNQQLISKTDLTRRLEQERNELRAEVEYYKAKVEELERETGEVLTQKDKSTRSSEAKLAAEVLALRDQLEEVQHECVRRKQNKLYSENRKLTLKTEWMAAQAAEEQKRPRVSDSSIQQQSKESSSEVSADPRRSFDREPKQQTPHEYVREEGGSRGKLPGRTVANYSSNVSQVLKWETMSSSPEADKHQAAQMTFPSLQYLADNQAIIDNLEDKLSQLNQENTRLEHEYDRLEEQPRSQATIRRKEELELELSIMSTNINNIRMKLRKYQVLK